jgi:hypothetical protein
MLPQLRLTTPVPQPAEFIWSHLTADGDAG